MMEIGRAKRCLKMALGFFAFCIGSATFAADIDFENLPEGKIVDQVSSGAGVTGDLKGHVNIFGFNPAFGASVNAAVIYDSSCPPGGVPSDCSGEDEDLGTPNQDFGGPGVGIGGEL